MVRDALGLYMTGHPTPGQETSVSYTATEVNALYILMIGLRLQ